MKTGPRSKLWDVLQPDEWEMSMGKLKDNRGMSLVELIVVVAILAVMVGVGLTTFSAVSGADVRECSGDMYSAIGRTRISTMGKKSTRLIISKDAADGGIYVQEEIEGNLGDRKRIGKSSVSVNYIEDNGSGGQTTVNLTPGAELILAFDRGSGAFKEISPSTYCTGITVSKGSHVRNITLYPVTGKISIE